MQLWKQMQLWIYIYGYLYLTEHFHCKVACSVLVAFTADRKLLAVLWPLGDRECRQSCLLLLNVPPTPINRAACVPQGADNGASDSLPPVSRGNWPQPRSAQAWAAWAVLAQLKQEHQVSYSPDLNRAQRWKRGVSGGMRGPCACRGGRGCPGGV